MAKFKLKGKGFTKELMHNGQPILLTTAGIIGTQKFLDFKTLMPNANPDGFLMKQEGLVKLGGALIAVSAFKNMPPWLKFLLYGVAIQGAIKATKQMTTNKDTGKAFFESIGNADLEEQINALADQVKDSVTTQYQTGVSGFGDALQNAGQLPETVSLMQNSQTGVSGMGMNDSIENLMGF